MFNQNLPILFLTRALFKISCPPLCEYDQRVG